jgi:hypothetical protein
MKPFLQDELAHALLRERSLVQELHETLLAQRAAIAANDIAAVQAGIEALPRILLTLGEARELRGRIVADLTGATDCHLEDIEAILGRELPAGLCQARATLKEAVEAVVQQVAINHTVLRRAVENGEAFLQALFASAGEPSKTYTAVESRGQDAGPAVLLNRKA